MENKDIKRNIGLTFDFVRDLIAHPEKAKEMPNQGEIEFIEKEFDESQIEDAKKKTLIKVKNTFEMVKPPQQKSLEHHKN